MTHVLVVDDHAITREPLARLLRIEGFEASVASNGFEALDKIRSSPPDIILLDLMMPKMDGVALLTELRQDARCKDIPVILMTSLSEGLGRRKGTDACLRHFPEGSLQLRRTAETNHGAH